MAEETTVRLVTREGRLVDVPAEDAEFHVQTLGSRPANISDETRTAIQQRKSEAASTPLQKAQGLAEAGARGLTLGLSTAALDELGFADKESQLDRKRALGGVGTAVELTSAIVPSLLGGGALLGGSKLAGAAKFTPVGALSAGAAKAGGAITKKLGGGALASLAGLGAEGAIEGGVFSAGQTISNLTLHDKPITAEAVAGGVFSGAGLGLLTGGGAFALTQVGSKLAKRGRRIIDAGSDEGKSFLSSLRAADDVIEQELKNVRVAAKAADPADVTVRGFKKNPELVTRALPGRRAAEVSEEVLAEAKKARKSLDKALGTQYTPDNFLKFLNKADLDKQGIQAIKAYDNYIEASRKAISKEAGASLDAASDMYLESFRAAAEKASPGSSKLIDRVVSAAEVAEIADLAGVDIDGPLGPVGASLVKLVAIGGFLSGRGFAGKAASKQSGFLGNLVRSGAGRGGEALIGGVAQRAGAGFVGQAAARGVANVAARKGASKLLDGDIMQALAAQQQSRGRIGRALAKTGRGAARRVVPKLSIRTALDELFSEEERPQLKATDTQPQVFAKKLAAMNKLMGNPERLIQRANELTEGLQLIDPELADLVRQQIITGAQFLHSKMPQDPGTQRTLIRSRWQVDEIALEQWMRYVKAVADPPSSIEDFANARLTPEAAEALKTVHPRSFAVMQEQLLENPERLERLSYEQQTQLGFLLDVPVNPMSAITPQLQEHFGDEQAQGNQQPQVTPPVQGPTKTVNNLTSTQQTTLTSDL